MTIITKMMVTMNMMKVFSSNTGGSREREDQQMLNTFLVRRGIEKPNCADQAMRDVTT